MEVKDAVFGIVERCDRVQFSLAGEDSLRTFLPLSDNMPKGWRELLSAGLGCGLMINIVFDCSWKLVATTFFSFWTD